MSSNDPLPPVPVETAPARGGALRVGAAVASAAWLAAAAAHLHFALGWELAGLPTAEAAVLAGGIALPLVVLWQAVLWAENGRALRREAELLRRRLDLLVHPGADADTRLAAVGQTLRRQAAAMEELERGTARLAREAARLDQVTEAAAARARDVEAGLLTQTRAAAQASETALEVVEGSFRRILDQSALLESGTRDSCERIAAAADALGAGVADIRSLGEDTAARSEEQVAALVRALADTASQLIAACERGEAIAAWLAERGDTFDDALAGHAQRITAAAERLDAVAARAEAAERAVHGRAESLAAACDAAVAALLDAAERTGLDLAPSLDQLEIEGSSLRNAAKVGAARIEDAAEALAGRRGELERAARGLADQAEATARLIETPAAILEGAVRRLEAAADRFAAPRPEPAAPAEKPQAGFGMKLLYGVRDDEKV